MTRPAPRFRPVLVGADQGIYGLARAFHESYGVSSTVVARATTGGISHSRIVTVVPYGGGPGDDRDALLRTLLDQGRALRAAEPDVPLLLLCNADSHALAFAEHAQALSEHYVFPHLSRETLAQVADKTHVAALCERVGLSTPRTSVVGFAGADDPDWVPDPVEVSFPVVAKPDRGAAYESLRFPGARKIYFLDTPQERGRLTGRLRDAGFRDDFLVQELIPGDDTHELSVVASVDRSGRVTAMATAQVLLGEHHPMALGNPAAMITTPLPELMSAAEQILGEVDYWGFANIDAKVDSRTGDVVYMEMNPRMGRNNYYATAAGADIVGAVVDDVVLGVRREPRRGTREILLQHRLAADAAALRPRPAAATQGAGRRPPPHRAPPALRTPQPAPPCLRHGQPAQPRAQVRPLLPPPDGVRVLAHPVTVGGDADGPHTPGVCGPPHGGGSAQPACSSTGTVSGTSAGLS